MEPLKNTSEVTSDRTQIKVLDAPAVASGKEHLLTAKEFESQDDRTQINVVLSHEPSAADLAGGDGESIGVSSMIKDRFVVVEALGSGGMGMVYKVRDLRMEEAGDSNPYLAMKVLGDEFKKHPHAFKTMQREARKTQKLNHPNIVQVHDFDRDGDTIYMTMEYLEGETLDKMIQRSRPNGLPFRGAAQLIKSIANAMQAAHDAGIVHADLKPGNIFITKEGNVKIIDFGIARAVTEGADDKEFDVSHLGGLTPAYASLEMLMGASPEPSDDLYALAVVAYELFTSKHPFKRKSAKQAEDTHEQAKKPKSLTLQQWSALKKGLSYMRADRYASAVVFAKEVTHTNLKLFGQIAAVVVFVVALGIAAWQPISAYKSKYDELALANQWLAEIASKTPQDVVAALRQLEQFEPIIQQGILRSLQPEVISAYRAYVTDQLKMREIYPDFTALNNTLDELRAMYPDSQAVTDLFAEAKDKKGVYLSELEIQLYDLLGQQAYAGVDGGASVPEIVKNLRRIEPTYEPRLDTRYVRLFDEALMSSVMEHQYDVAVTVTQAGVLLFSDLGKPGMSLMAPISEYAQAAASLQQYQRSQADGGQQVFPTDAAATFYKPYLEAMAVELSRLKDSKKLLDFERDLRAFSTPFPEGFAPINELYRRFAYHCLSLADEMIADRKLTDAQKLMTKANGILRAVGS